MVADDEAQMRLDFEEKYASLVPGLDAFDVYSMRELWSAVKNDPGVPQSDKDLIFNLKEKYAERPVDADDGSAAIRDYLQSEYNIDASNPEQLQRLKDALTMDEDVAYIDSEGRVYTYQNPYYESHGKQETFKVENDEEANPIYEEALRVHKEIQLLAGNAVMDQTTARRLTELGDELKGYSEQLAGMGYDLDHMLVYADTEEAKLRYLMRQQATAERTREHPVLMNLYSKALAPVSAFEWLLNDWGRGDPSDLANYIPQNYYGMDATNDKAAIRNTTMEMIQDSIINAGGSKFLANLASETYAGVDSAVESRLLAIACIALMGPMLGESVAYALSSPASLGARYGEAIALALMGNSAASGKMREAIDNGLDNSHVVMSALSSGIAEVTFEKVSLDKLLSETGSFDRANVWKSIMDMLKSSGSQRLVEGSEEIFTNLADTITDFLINGDMSQLSKDITKYEKQNMSPYEARQKAWSDYVGETLQAGFGGFIGGGGELHYLGSAAFNAAMSPVQRAYDTYQQNRNYQNVGNAVINNQNVDALVREAQNTGNDALMNLANQVAAAQNSDVVKPSRKDEKVFKTNVGKLATETVKTSFNEAVEGGSKAINEAIKSELEARGIEPSAQNVNIIEKLNNNQALTYEEKVQSAKINAPEVLDQMSERISDVEAKASEASDAAFKRAEDVRRMATADLSEKVSNTGEVTNKNGDTVEIAEISGMTIEDGKPQMTLKLKDGSRVNSDDIQYADSTQAMLYEAVRASGVNPEVGNAMIRAFEGKGTTNAFKYVQGMVEGLNYGRTNQTAEMAPKNTFFADLTPYQQNMAIRLGQIQTETETGSALKRVSELAAQTNGTKRTGSVTGITSRDTGLNNAQRTGIRAIEMLVDNGALTNNFRFFASEDVNGKRVLTADIGGLKKGAAAPNGFYDPKTGDIYIDVNAGNSGEGTVLFTAAHELTHFVKQWSPNKFNDLANFLVQEYHGAGTSVDSLVRNQMRKGGNRNLSYDDAFEEMVADAMQTMFTDGNLAAKLMDLKAKDKTLFDKIMDFVKKFQAGINKVYARYEPESEEAKALSQIKGAVDRLADAFAEGITAATENYNATDASNLSAKEIKDLKAKGLSVVNGLIVADNLEALAAQVRKPGSLNIYSYRTEPEWEKSVIAQWGDTEETRRYINAVKAFTDAMVADDAIRKIVPMGSYLYDTHGPLRENQEYVVTFDMDTSCPRTFQFTKYRDHLQAYAKRPLTYNESVNLLELMRVYGQNIPCSYCYVENKRVLLSASYNNFFAYRNDVLNEKDPKKAMKKMYGYNAKKGVLSDAAQKAFDNWRSDMNYNPTVQDIWDATQTARNSVFNFLDDQLQRGNINIKNKQNAIEELVCDHFGVKGQTPRAEVSGFVSEWIYDTFAEKEHTYFKPNNTDVSEVDVRALALNHEALGYAKSSSSAKLVSSYVPYTDQLKNIDPKTKAYVIGMGGIRKHSSNDFRIDYVQDYLMFYADLAAGGWTGHTYTKSPDFVKIFGNTGDRINMSIAMTDGPNGEVRENELEGMYWKVAKELRNAYKNAGVMSMVTSDAQLSYALNADWIDMIIPFHASSLDKHVWYDLRHWFDYTSKQLERFLSSKDMKLALIQKALDDAGVEYSSDEMRQKLIDVAREKGAGALSKDTDKIKQAEISRLVKLAAKNGVQFNNKMSAKEIETAYNTAFGVKTLYNAEGKRIKPHFLPGETVVDGVTIPGHGNDVQKYLDLCREYGVHPRFDGVAVQDKNGNYINVVDHEGYLKLIKETARTDSDQEKIQFNFDKYDDYLKMTPMEYALQQLHDNADIGMYDNMSEDPMGIQKKFIDDYLGKNRDIGWLPEYAEDFKEYREEQQNKENTGDINELPGYDGIKQSAREFPDRIDSDADTSNPDYHYSARITDPMLLDSLNNQEYITTYRTMQIIDGGLYSPMNSLEDTGENGKRTLGFRSELGQWEMATEAPEKTKPKKLKNGDIVWTYDLKDAHGNTDAVAYNPYEHSANYVLNDQFTGAYKRDNIVVVECRVPVSEANGAYRAEKAHNATGWTSWHKGPVAAKIAKATKNSANPFDRRLFLSRYLMPVRIVPDAEVARMYGDYLRGTGVDVNWNVVSPSLLEELVKQGVPVTDKPSSASVKDKMPENLRQMMNQTRGEDVPKLSARDQEYMDAVNEGNMTKVSALVDDAAKAAGYTIRAFHGTAADFTKFSRGEQGKNYDGYLQFGAGFYFTPSEAEAKKWVERRRHKDAKENPKVMSVFLNPGRILNVNAMVPEAERDLKAMGLAPAEINYLSAHAYRLINWMLGENGFTNTEVQDELKSWGYDALEDVNSFKTKGQYIIFDPEMIKSADPVTYDNDGNVIPLSERFNAESPDIRYSARDSEGNTLTPEQQEYFKDSKVRDEDGNLLVVYHGTDADFTVFDKTKGRSTMDIQGMFFSPWEIDAAGYGSNVQAYYLNIKNPAPEGLAYKALNLYKGQNNAGVKARNYLEKKGYDGVNNGNEEFIAFNSEQIKLVGNQAPTADPDIRFSERDPDSLDTRTVLSNALLDTAQNDVERKYIEDYQSKIAAMNEEQNRLNEIRNDIRNMTFGKAPHTKEHLKSLKEEVTRLANRINVYDKQLLRIEAMKPMKAVIDREKARVQTRIRAEQATFMTDYKNKVSSREYIARIEHEVKGLRDRLMHPSAKTIIPESFAKPVSQFLSAIDFGTYYADGTRRSGKANVTREQLRQRLEALGNSIDETSIENEYGQLDFDPMMVDWIKNTVQYLNDNFSADDTYALRKMSAEELANLYKIVTSLRTAVNNAGKMYTNMAASIGSLGADTIDYLEPIFNRERSRVGARVYKTLGWDYAQPVTVFDRFGDAGKKVFKGLLNGQKKEANNVQQILDFVDTAYTREEVNSWQEDMKNVTIDGTDYQIPASYIMELYCMMKDADARRHIVEGGGIRFDDLTYGRAGRRRTKTFDNTLITEDEVNAMIGTLTDRQKEAADQIHEFMDRVGADWGNEISMRRFGYHAFGQIPNYYPIRTIKQGSEYEAQQKRTNIYALLNKSFTKERITNANNTVIIGDIFKTFSDHMSEMAVYNAWALPVIDTIKWFNYREAQDLDAGIPERSVKDAIRKAYGAEKSNPADEYIRRLLESINGQRSGGLSESLAFHSLRMMNRVAVAANIRVAVQQPFSITRAFTLISPRYIRPMSVATMRQEYNEMVENSSFGRWKGMGYYDVDIARPLQTQVLKSETLSDRVTQHSMRLAELGDQFTWSTLWHACKLEAQAQHKTGDALIKATTEKFDEIISRTQVVDSVLKKSQWMRSDSFWHRMTSAFMSEPMTSYNLLLQQYDKFVRDAAEVGRQESVRRNWRSIAGALTVFAITELVNAMVTAPIDAMRDDDDYKTYWEKLLEKFKKNATQNAIPTNMMPFLADITDYLIYGSQDRADLSIYTKAIDTAKMIYQAIANGDGLTIYKRNKLIMAALTMTSQITGLPISNTARDAISIWNTVTDRIDFGSLKFQTAEDKNTVGYKQFLKALKAGNDDRKDYIYLQLQSNGVEHDTAYTGVKNLLKDEYYDGENVTSNLVKTIQYFDEQPYQMAWNTAKFLESWWTYCKENPSDERVLTYSAYEKYYAEAMPAGIDVKTYEKYYKEIKDLTKDQVLPIIDEQPLTNEQKDTLYYMKKYGAKAIGDTPWHKK
jgi:hypothetical protein